jgi:crotonobetainyl-CoA:carnitine CoA-transferase CaiB-like acyl-CoA transferase
LIDDPHLAAVAFFTSIPVDDDTAMRLTGVPVLFDGERPPVRRPPRLGEHTDEVLREAGLSPEQIAALSRGQ